MSFVSPNHVNKQIAAFLNAYLTNRSVEETLACLSDDICWLGSTSYERGNGTAAVRALLIEDMATYTSPILYEITDYTEIPAGTNAVQILCQLKLTDSTGDHKLSDMRVSFTCVTENEKPVITAIHASVPLTYLDSRSFFPVSKAEINLQHNLIDSQREMNLLMDNIQAGVAVLKYKDSKLTPLFFNERLCKMLHATESEIRALYGKDAYAGVHPEDKARVIHTFETSVSRMRCFDESFRLQNTDKSYTWVSVRAVPMKRTDGSIYYYIVYTDLTAERKMLEEAKLRENALKTAAEQTGMNMWVLNLNTRALLQSKNYLAIDKHLSAEKITNVPAYFFENNLIHQDDVIKVQKMYDAIYRGKPHAECTARWRSDTGGWLFVRTIYTIMYDEDGKPIKAIGSAMDVNEQMKLQRQYKEFEAYQHLMLDTSFAAFKVNVTKDRLEEVIHFEGNFNAMARVKTLTEFTALSIQNIPDEDEKKRHQAVFLPENLLKSYEAGITHLEYECRYQINAATCHWARLVINLTAHPVTGDVIGYTYGNDIEVEKLFESAAEHMLQQDFDRIVFIDTNTSTYRRLYSASGGKSGFIEDERSYDDELAYRALHYIYPEDRRRYIAETNLDTVRQHLEHHKDYAITLRGLEKDGTVRIKRYSFSYIGAKKDTILLTRSDITKTVQEQNEMTARLESALNEAKRADAAKSDFLSRMSHDMRTPMNGIIGLTQLALDLPDLSEDALSYLHGIQGSGRYLLSLINDILDMSKIDSRIITLHPKPENAYQIYEEIIGAVKTLAMQKNIFLNLKQINTSLGTIYTDKVRLQQIFINILSNAIKFTPSGGQIDMIIECLSQEDDIFHDRLIVRDNGIGMSEEFLPKMFEPFEQEHYKSSVPQTGTGLGMSIVKQLVEAMGGSISVKSELGVGTEVCILMDFQAAAPPAKKAVQAPASNHLAGRHILICEDHPVNMLISKKLLEKKGAVVTEALDGLEGLNTYLDAPEGFYDAILMDIRMPQLNGLETAKAIRKAERADAKTIPIIAMTANAYESDRKKSERAGMNAHLAKPINPDELYAALTRCLNEANQVYR